ISKSGAKFDFEKAKWFNHEWIKQSEDDAMLPRLTSLLATHGVYDTDKRDMASVWTLVKDRLTFIADFWEQASYFFKRPETYDLSTVQPKWNEEKTAFFEDMITKFEVFEPWHRAELESVYKLAIQ